MDVKRVARLECWAHWQRRMRAERRPLRRPRRLRQWRVYILVWGADPRW